MHRRRVTPAVAAALALTLAQPAARALAQQPAEQAAVAPIVVTATRIESTLATSPDAITVVTREDIERLQARFAADVLETVPGVVVSRTGQLGGFVSAFLRGANSTHTLVLVDGVRANNAFNGRFDFVDVPVDNIERIEVVRGPQSTRYGSEALGGVINIVTRKGAPRTTGTALVEGGSNDSLRARGAVATGGGAFGVSAEISALRTDNERDNGEYRGAGGNFGASWRPSPRLDLALTGSHRQSESGTPNDVFTNDPNDETTNDGTHVTLALHALPAAWWDTRLALSASREKVVFDGPEPNPPYFSGDLRTETLSKSLRADWQNVFTPAAAHRVSLGLSADEAPTEYESTSAFGDATLDETMRSRALFGQYDWSPAKSFTLSAGARVDDFSSFGTHTTWRAGGRYTVAATGTILRANAGTGFRAPTIADLFYPNFSNPDLEPEESTGWDAGVEQPLLGGRLQVGATWFHNDFDNLIAYSAAAMRPENIAEARTDGVEAFAQWSPAEALDLTASYTWLRTAEDRATGERLLRRPEHSGSVAAHYRFARLAALDTSLRLAGESADKNFSSFPAEDVTNDGYAKWDLGLTLTPWEGVSFVGRVENLLDEEYEEAFGFPALGRVFWAGVQYAF